MQYLMPSSALRNEELRLKYSTLGTRLIFGGLLCRKDSMSLGLTGGDSKSWLRIASTQCP